MESGKNGTLQWKNLADTTLTNEGTSPIMPINIMYPMI